MAKKKTTPVSKKTSPSLIPTKKTILMIVLVLVLLGLFPLAYQVYLHITAVSNELGGDPVANLTVSNFQPPLVDQEASSTPQPSQPTNVYAYVMGTVVNPSVKNIPMRVYVPNSGDGTVTVIDPKSFKIIDHYKVGEIPHHITPSWDLTELYVDNEGSSFMTIIDPLTGKPAGTVPVGNVYNLYFTPDGTTAVAVIERYHRLDFYNATTWKLEGRLDMPWFGADHMDFSADGSYFLISTEWSGVVAKVDPKTYKIIGSIDVGGNPIDVKISPDGSVFYVTNQGVFQNGVTVIDPVTMKKVGFIPTGNGAHGLQVSRDSKSLYVSNRLGGTISVMDLATRKVRATWPVGDSPDMFQLSPDGQQLWVTARFNNAVYVLDTTTGKTIQKIVVGKTPHGLTYFPNVGRYSIGHNGVYR